MKILEQLSVKEIKEYAAYLDHYKGDPVIREVLSGRTTFVKELETFYHTEIGSLDCLLKKAQPTKRGSQPSELIEILNNFQETRHGVDLTYEKVREGIHHFNAYNTRYMLTGLAGIFIGIPTVIAGGTIVAVTYNNPLLGMGVTMGGFLICLGRIIYEGIIDSRCQKKGLPHPKNKPGKIAFDELHKTAELADDFVKDYLLLKEKQLL